MGVSERTTTSRGRRHTALCRGVTLVETLVAVAVFAVGIVSLLPLTVTTVRSNENAGVRSQALALAQSKIEDLRALPYDDMVNLPAGNEVLPEGYTRRWGLVDVPLQRGDGDDLRRLVVTVCWDRPGPGPGSVSLLVSRGRY